MLIVLLVAVVLFALLLGADNFTYANLRYLLRNFGEATVNDTDLAETIEFDIDADISVGVFGGKLAVAGEESFALYRMSGKKVYSEASEYRESIISCGEKYTVLWSYGERSIYVYNAVSLIHKETFERPVYGVAVDDKGGFAVLTGDELYAGTIRLYTADFRLALTKNIAAGNVAHFELSDDGSRMTTAIFNTRDGEYVSSFAVSDTKNGIELFSFEYPAELALKTGFFANGGSFCLTDRSLYVYGADGTVLHSARIPEGLKMVYSDSKHVCTVSNRGESLPENTVQVVSSEGSVVSVFTWGSAISDVCLTSEHVFLLGPTVRCVSLEDGSKTDIARDGSADTLLSFEDRVYCIYPDRAELIFNDGKPIIHETDDK